MPNVPFNGLCGPTYAYENKYAAIERCINFYPTANETDTESKFKFSLDECPGTSFFGQLPVPAPFNGIGQALLQYQDILYGITAGTGSFTSPIFWLMNASGNYVSIGNLTNFNIYNGPVSMVGTGTGQIFICAGGSTSAYVYAPGTNPPSTGTLTYVPGSGGVPFSGFLGANVCTFQDGYVLVSAIGTRQVQISGNAGTPVGDCTLWDASNVVNLVGQADYIVNLISSREYVRIFGNRRSQVFYNAGANGLGGFPFQSYNETYIETGLAATFSLTDLGDSLLWIGQDARGITAAWRDFGFQPQRISTFAVEQMWQSYGPTAIAGSVAFAYKWKGHLFWQITFVGVATWVYDATVSQLVGRPTWHERTYQTATGALTSRSELYHAFCYGKHLVLSFGTDGNPGAVYQYTDSYSDLGANSSGTQVITPIIPDRICPHIYDGLNRLMISRLRLDSTRPMNMQVSKIGSTPTGTVYTPTQSVDDPQMSYYTGCFGAGRDFVIRLTGDNTVNSNGIVDASLDIQELAT